MDYEVVIGGGSFAGLAVAAQLRRRRVLLVEPHDIGAVQTSACGTLLAILEATGTMDSLLQIHDRFILHLRDRTVEYNLPYPFCTFDYRTFCDHLLEQCDVEILHASILGHHSHLVYTTSGVYDAKVLVDATGWRAALATNNQGQKQVYGDKSFGLETDIQREEDGLHFYYGSRYLGSWNVGWLFPAGAFSRTGIASYQGHTRLNKNLSEFVWDQFAQSPDGRHGGYFPYHRQPATSGEVFRVGDPAGQCLPFTGEGIRPALYFGSTLGRLVRRVLEGGTTEDQALQTYRKFVRSHSLGQPYLLTAQKGLPGLPIRWIETIARIIQRPEWLNLVLWWYWDLIDPTELALRAEIVMDQTLPLPNLSQSYAQPEVQLHDR